MALSFFISLFVTYTDIANRQTTNIFFGFLGIHSSDAREKKEKEKKKKKKKRKKGKRKKEKLVTSGPELQKIYNILRITLQKFEHV